MKADELLPIFVEDAQEHLRSAEALLAKEGVLSRGERNDLFRHFHSVKGMAASLGFDELVSAAHEAEEAVDALRRSGALLDRDGRARLAARVAELRAGVESRAGAATRDTPRPPRAQPVAAPVATPTRSLPFVRVSDERLDAFLDLALRLSAAQQRLEHRLGLPNDPELGALRDELSGTVRTLRREVLELRLQPLRTLSPLLREAFTRWSRELGREAELVITGDGVRVDRSILERLVDPLGNLLRNALLHGVEPPAERRRLGKPVPARVRLLAQRQQGRVVVTVEDDGRGAKAEEIVERARVRGVIAAGAHTELPRDDAFALLARAGMSSRSDAGHLGGRGVGLSTVRDELTRLGGSLQLDGGLGEGFVATLRLPARVAVLEAFLVEAGGQVFAIPVADVREVVSTGATAGAETRPLAAALGLPEEATPLALVVEEEGRLIEIPVERVLGRREVLLRPLGAPLDLCAPWAGAAALPDGRLALVVDLARLERLVSATMAR